MPLLYSSHSGKSCSPLPYSPWPSSLLILPRWLFWYYHSQCSLQAFSTHCSAFTQDPCCSFPASPPFTGACWRTEWSSGFQIANWCCYCSGEKERNPVLTIYSCEVVLVDLSLPPGASVLLLPPRVVVGGRGSHSLLQGSEGKSRNFKTRKGVIDFVIIIIS